MPVKGYLLGSLSKYVIIGYFKLHPLNICSSALSALSGFWEILKRIKPFYGRTIPIPNRVIGAVGVDCVRAGAV